jgi:hypothetical protein
VNLTVGISSRNIRRSPSILKQKPLNLENNHYDPTRHPIPNLKTTNPRQMATRSNPSQCHPKRYHHSTNNPRENLPLRGLPITISEDFDDPMPELWEALTE